MAGFASGKNWGTSPDSATFTSDIGSATRLATSAPFSRYMTEQIVEKSLMIQSGLVAVDSRLNNITGVLKEIDFFDQLNFVEENVDSSATWGTITPNSGRYTTQNHTADVQYAPIVTRGGAFAADMLSKVETGEDTLENVTAQMTRAINKNITTKVISQFTGLFGTALAGNSLNVAAAAGAEASGENFLQAESLTRAKYLLGENASDVSVLVVHPLVAADMEVRGMLTFQNSGGTVEYASNGVGITDTRIGFFAGQTVLVDSQVPKVTPTSGTSGDPMGYVCYLAAPGVVRTGSQFPLMVKTSDDILSLQDIMSVTYNRIDHVMGTSYGGPMHPENSDLADKDNWSLAYQSLENVPLIEMIVNTPYGQKVA